MAKRNPPPIGRCVHCLADNVVRNWDHVFPRSWYPDSTPPNTSKWIMPTCHKCNSEYGVLEHDMLIRLACCVEPHAAEASGIFKKVLRSMDPSQASSEADARSRSARRDKFLAEVRYGDEIPVEGAYPGLEERWNRPKNQQSAIMIPVSSFKRLTEKIVRGIFYIEDKMFIESSNSISFYTLHDDGAKPIAEILDQLGTEHSSGPGILIKRAVAPQDNVSSLMSIEIWKTFKMYASVDSVTT